MCKIQIAVQPLIDIQSLNPSQIATSQTSVPLIYVLFFKFSNRRPILKPMVISHFSNRNPMTSLTYALTNKSDIDLRILKDSDLRIPLNRTVIWDNDISGCQFESGRWSESIICIHNKNKNKNLLLPIKVPQGANNLIQWLKWLEAYKDTWKHTQKKKRKHIYVQWLHGQIRAYQIPP